MTVGKGAGLYLLTATLQQRFYAVKFGVCSAIEYQTSNPAAPQQTGCFIAKLTPGQQIGLPAELLRSTLTDRHESLESNLFGSVAQLV